MLQEKNFLRVITYDLRGHGQSDIGDGQYTIELFVDDLIAMLDYLNIPKATFCGFSMGGYIALRAIQRNPDRFRSLILCDTISAADSNNTKIRRANSIKLVKKQGVGPFAEEFLKTVFAPKTFETKPNIVDKMRRIILSNPPLGICGALLAMAGRTDTTEVLSNIHVPTLIMVGEYDPIASPSLAKSMHDMIPNSRLHLIQDAAHMSNLENVGMFNKYLVEFMDEID